MKCGLSILLKKIFQGVIKNATAWFKAKHPMISDAPFFNGK